MNKYVVEDNFDFFKELSLDQNENKEETNQEICLLNKEPLDENKVTLSCNHSFNYIPLYNEICKQKIFNSLEVTKLKINQIKCPYCREVSNELLPHVKINNSIKYIFGVNSPVQMCMIINKCSYTFKSGKNKGVCCGKSAIYFENNYYCTQHKQYASKQKLNKDNSNKSEMRCNAILKTGKNKGSQCKCKAIENSEYCKRHNK